MTRSVTALCGVLCQQRPPVQRPAGMPARTTAECHARLPSPMQAVGAEGVAPGPQRDPWKGYRQCSGRRRSSSCTRGLGEEEVGEIEADRIEADIRQPMNYSPPPFPEVDIAVIVGLSCGAGLFEEAGDPGTATSVRRLLAEMTAAISSSPDEGE